MLAVTETLDTIANRWLAKLEQALARGDEAALAGLFRADSHWRDVLALTWNIQTVSGRDAVAAELKASWGKGKAKAFKVDSRRTPPREALATDRPHVLVESYPTPWDGWSGFISQASRAKGNEIVEGALAQLEGVIDAWLASPRSDPPRRRDDRAL